MKLDDEYITELVLDGQIVYLLDSAAIEELLAKTEIDGIPIGSMDIIKHMMIFVRRHSGFSLIFYRLGKLKNWVFCIVYRVDSRWQRVQIENLTCSQCGWKGLSANPTIPELYLGSPNRWNALEQVGLIQSVDCPVCSAELPRPTIWTITT